MADHPGLAGCRGCGLRTRAYFMCDEVADAVWCDPCFAHTDCGQGRHGEGCFTFVCEADDTPGLPL